MLRRLSVPFDTANDGIEAIEQICKTRYDLVLMDLSMPRVRSRPYPENRLNRHRLTDRSSLLLRTDGRIGGDAHRAHDRARTNRRSILWQ
jgi:CheY-like chemotaxis protein